MKPVTSEKMILSHISEANLPHFPRDVFPELLFRLNQVSIDPQEMRSRVFCLQPTPGVNQSSVQCLRHYRVTAGPYRAFVDVDGELCVSQLLEMET